MPDSKIHALKATELLKADHRKVKALFAKYAKLGEQAETTKQAVFDEVCEELTIHATIEEEIFYPAVANSENPEAADMVAEGLEEHKIVKTLLDELAELTPDDDTFDAKMKVLTESVEHHAGEEESEMFPIFEKLPKETKDEVSEQLRARKDELAEQDDV